MFGTNIQYMGYGEGKDMLRTRGNGDLGGEGGARKGRQRGKCAGDLIMLRK